MPETADHDGRDTHSTSRGVAPVATTAMHAGGLGANRPPSRRDQGASRSVQPRSNETCRETGMRRPLGRLTEQPPCSRPGSENARVHTLALRFAQPRRRRAEREAVRPVYAEEVPMTRPVSSDASSSDITRCYSDPNPCDPTVQSCTDNTNAGSCPAPSGSPAPSSQVIDLDPVYVTGDAGSRSLVEKHCAEERKRAIVSCAAAIGSAAGAVSAAAAPSLFVGALIGTVADGVTCGEGIAALYFCER